MSFQVAVNAMWLELQTMHLTAVTVALHNIFVPSSIIHHQNHMTIKCWLNKVVIFWCQTNPCTVYTSTKYQNVHGIFSGSWCRTFYIKPVIRHFLFQYWKPVLLVISFQQIWNSIQWQAAWGCFMQLLNHFCNLFRDRTHQGIVVGGDVTTISTGLVML